MAPASPHLGNGEEDAMNPRHLAPALILGSFLVAPGPVGADKLEKQDRAWLEDEVAAIIVPSEAKVFRDMKKDDRAEFIKIFWARRDPDPEGAKPENEFKASFLKLKAEADKRYRVAGHSGGATDCGRVFILLGEPDSVRTEQRDSAAPGSRNPETWIFKDNPSRPMRFVGGEMQITFDESCQIPGLSRFTEQLMRVAEAKITRPNVDYRFGKDGRLVKLVDLLPKPSPAQTLLKEPRQDFPVEAQSMFLKTQDGGTALVGLVRGNAEGLSVQEVAGKKAIKLMVAAQAVGEDGRAAAFYEQATTTEVGADGRFTASFRLGLKPGKYTIRAGALDEATKKGALASSTQEVPDLNNGELSAASLIVLGEIQENATNDPAHPYSAFLIGTARIVPYFGSVFGKTEPLSFFYQYYDAKLNETGKASVTASLAILKGGKTPVARAADQPFELAIGGNVIGPVPLDKYEPGPYTVQLKIKDNVANKDLVREFPFEIK
jgi:GWxTD domain-containing protein